MPSTPDIHLLRDESILSILKPKEAAPFSSKTSRWLSWRPLMAAAAGIVFGIFCTSVVFAYVAPSLGKVTMLLRESFESGPAPLAKGVPVEPGVWSGDYTEVVGEQHGVRPESGRKILRFLRADYVGKTNTKESHVADIYRLIDVRLYGQEFADGSAVVQLSALFNAFEFPRGETYVGKLSIHAFDAETVTNGSWRTASAWDEIGLATATAGPTRLDRNPTTWQRLTGDLRLPDLLGTAKGPAREATLHQSISGALAIRQGPWKLIFPNDGQRELYNLQTDLSETKNVAGANPEVVERLAALMKKYIAEGRSTVGAPQKNEAAFQLDGTSDGKKKKGKKAGKKSAKGVPAEVEAALNPDFD